MVTQPATPEVTNVFTAHFPKWDLGGFVSYFKKNTEVFLSYKEQSYVTSWGVDKLEIIGQGIKPVSHK